MCIMSMVHIRLDEVSQQTTDFSGENILFNNHCIWTNITGTIQLLIFNTHVKSEQVNAVI